MSQYSRFKKTEAFIFWEPVNSPHKSDFFIALNESVINFEVICVADQNLSIDRVAMGWSIPTQINYELVIAPSDEKISSLIINNPNALHVLSGIRHVPTIVKALKIIKQQNAKFAIMSEPRVFEGYKGWLRYFQSRFTEGWLRRNVSFVLAIGRNGPPWFKLAGYNKTKIFPFAYFINAPKLDVVNRSDNPRSLIKVTYVGRLVQEKGIEYLLQAVAKIPNHHLTIIGDGENKKTLMDIACMLSLNIDFLGILPIHQIPNSIAKADVLVLPSITKDGWGVVISEALLSGTAAIATNHVGASAVLDHPLMGRVVPAKNHHAITDAILSLKNQGAYTAKQRIERQAKANTMLSAKAGATYFMSIVEQLNKKSVNSNMFKHFE